MADQSRWPRLVPWRAIDVVFGAALVIGGSVLAILAYVLAAQLLSGGEGQPTLTPWAGGLLVQGLMVLAVWSFGVLKYRASWRTAGVRGPEGRSSMLLPWLALLLSLGFSAAYTQIVTALGLESLVPEQVPRDVLGKGVYLLLSIAVIVFWVPFAEELFFRGFLLTALLRYLRLAWALVIGSAIFALGHISSLNSVGAVVPAFVSGLLLSWLFLKTRSIWPGYMAHMAQNLIAILAVLVSAMEGL